MFDPTAFKQLLHLQFFYSQCNNLVMAAALTEQIDAAIIRRNSEHGYSLTTTK